MVSRDGRGLKGSAQAFKTEVNKCLSGHFYIQPLDTLSCSSKKVPLAFKENLKVITNLKKMETD